MRGGGWADGGGSEAKGVGGGESAGWGGVGGGGSAHNNRLDLSIAVCDRGSACDLQRGFTMTTANP